MKIKFLTVLSLAVVLFLGACGGKSDADLKTASETALKGDPTTSTVTVDVKDGVATISGEVADDAAKTKAETLAKVEGVKSVTNSVTVKPAPAPPVAKSEDPELKTKLEEGLKSKGCDGATVEVKDGVATLRGTVPTAKFAECVMVANQAGAKKIENQLGKK
jgi:osmotically-inducible protein OsmY